MCGQSTSGVDELSGRPFTIQRSQCSAMMQSIKRMKTNLKKIKTKKIKNKEVVTKSVKSVKSGKLARPRWQDGVVGGGSTVWHSLSIGRWPVAGRDVVSLTRKYQDAVPGGSQCWLHHSSHPGTPQQGEQIA